MENKGRACGSSITECNEVENQTTTRKVGKNQSYVLLERIGNRILNFFASTIIKEF